ncbi:TIGR01777 family oxidoreductase [Mycetocola zhadangensis]|uniref:TIGR01777 family protein n=1 Tax=Mycetocola zhadangensis TaxID=1164595 RepID=A0A3L7IUZ5_9MICO|nr:TIGR01777 family oxidoreductase [Mycetocola zhadangensis]RLQ81301.1 TIGR01777 family protein [Mycetocola zhadangensis]GGF02945.1 epimerase [Mycetocola zhadangensis]
MRIVIAGASGLIGQALVAELSTRGHRVVRLVRRPARTPDELTWDPTSRHLDPRALSGADAVINLSGASIGRLPWSRRYRRSILSSRIDATSTLVSAIRGAEVPPRIFLSASAAGYYGSRPGEVLTEDSARGTGFLSDVTAQWEADAMRVSDITRVVTLRSGIVLDRDGVLKPLLLLTRLGVSGPLSSGTQYWPWVSLDDEVAAIAHLLDSAIEGPVNITGPTPASATTLMRHLAKRLKRPFWLPAPAFALRILLADAAKDLLLVDQQPRPKRLLADGFRFQQETAEAAVDTALARTR